MELIPLKTRRLEPPQDDFLAVLLEVLPPLKEGDVLVLASKAVAIHEGRCLPKEEANRDALIAQEADVIIPTGSAWDLTVKNGIVTFAAGLDESNVGDYVALLPEDPNASAVRMRDMLCTKYGLKNLGVIITDSSALPFRKGVIGLSIGHAGLRPVNDKTDAVDLFGRTFKYTYVNVVDALAVAAAFVMGETDESTPACIVRGAPHIEFTSEDCTSELRMPPEDDLFYPLFRKWM